MSGNSGWSRAQTAPIVMQALRGRGARLRSSCSSAQEGQAVLADLQLVVVIERGRLDPLAVHERAVEAAEVARS